MLFVESAQSMANRLEATCGDPKSNRPFNELEHISHVTVTRNNAFLTDTMLEAHRLNSPYLHENKQDPSFFKKLKEELGALAEGPIDRKLLARVLLRYDVGSLIHGVFLAKKELAGGRLRVARALSAFSEATGARVAASGGVKNDHVNLSGITKEGFGNVPFACDEFTAIATSTLTSHSSVATALVPRLNAYSWFSPCIACAACSTVTYASVPRATLKPQIHLSSHGAPMDSGFPALSSLRGLYQKRSTSVKN